MKVLIEGHKYEVANFEGDTTQTITFIRKMNVPDQDELQTMENGTTNEALIEILIDRLNYLNKKFPCRENALAITKLDEALLWLNKRTSDRIKRNVEGKHLS